MQLENKQTDMLILSVEVNCSSPKLRRAGGKRTHYNQVQKKCYKKEYRDLKLISEEKF